jgi:hypothetical protein
MSTWWRIAAGIGAGVANSVANGTSWKQIALSTMLGLHGIVSHLSSTSDHDAPNGKKLA